MKAIPENDLLENLKNILLEYGEDLTPQEYDDLNTPGKPSRSYLRKRIGLWQVCKNKALGGSYDITNEHLIKQNERLLAQLEKQRNVNQVIIDNCLARIDRCSFSSAKIPSSENVKSVQEFFALKSDDHVGELVDPAWVQGVAEYDVNVFKKRLGMWTHKVATFREQDKNALGLNKIIINMLGDHITGEMIYAGQAWNIDVCLVDQLFTCVNAYADALLFIANVFPEVELYCVQGNHGRHGKKGEGHPRSNFDYVFFRMLQKIVAQQENIKVYISESPTMLVRHHIFNFALNHNDDTRGWNGIPYYGLDRKARRLPKLYNMPIHFYLGGHFHSPASLNDETFLNGTMIGGTDLSINKMRVASRPSQTIFYLDPEHGIHRYTNIYLAKPTKLEADSTGIYTAYTS